MIVAALKAHRLKVSECSARRVQGLLDPVLVN